MSPTGELATVLARMATKTGKTKWVEVASTDPAVETTLRLVGGRLQAAMPMPSLPEDTDWAIGFAGGEGTHGRWLRGARVCGPVQPKQEDTCETN